MSGEHIDTEIRDHPCQTILMTETTTKEEEGILGVMSGGIGTGPGHLRQGGSEITVGGKGTNRHGGEETKVLVEINLDVGMMKGIIGYRHLDSIQMETVILTMM